MHDVPEFLDFVLLPAFVRKAERLLSEADIIELERSIERNPTAGDVEIVMETSVFLVEWGPLTDAVRIEESSVHVLLRSVWLLPADAPNRFVRLKVTRR